MAQRRMFSLKVVDTDAFMDMPLSAQALYFHLGMRADDDGFVSNARRIQRVVGASDDDFKILLMKRFLLSFESGVIVVKHWRIHNYVKNDRYTPTLYQEEKSTLFTKENGVYTDHPPLPPASTKENSVQAENPADLAMEPSCLQNGTILEPQVRLGEGRLGKERIGQVNSSPVGVGDAREAAEREVSEYCNFRGLDPNAFFGLGERERNELKSYSEAIFQRFTNRLPTRVDIGNVFHAIRESKYDPVTDEWIISFPKDHKDLLQYAFEQAAMAGVPGDWRYINGVLARLAQRGIQTLEDADAFDAEREGEK